MSSYYAQSKARERLRGFLLAQKREAIPRCECGHSRAQHRGPCRQCECRSFVLVISGVAAS